jgi:hypothetical protein
MTALYHGAVVQCKKLYGLKVLEPVIQDVQDFLQYKLFVSNFPYSLTYIS